MAQTPIKLVIAEDNAKMGEILHAFFEITPEVELCGIAVDGDAALKQVARSQPDVLLLDIIMPSTDGLAVLEKLRQTPMEKKPTVIVASAIGQETIIDTALALGASYYMIKPYNLQDLLSRICLIGRPALDEEPPSPKGGSKRSAGKAPAGEPQAAAPAERENALRTPGQTSVIAQRILELGMTTNTKGYQYCLDAVGLLIGSERHCSIVKEIYAEIAEKYDTTPACVESALRQAIRRVYALHNPAFRQLVSGEGSLLTRPPSNGRFLTMISERIRLDIR